MVEIFGALKDANIPTILAIAGIILILLAVGVEGVVKIPAQRQKSAAITGTILLLIGISLYLIPENPPQIASTSTPTLPTTQITAIPSTPMTQITAIPSATVQVSTRVSWLDNAIVDSDIIKQGNVLFEYSTDMLELSGQATGDRIWIKGQPLPNHSRITIVMRYPNRVCSTYIGFGDGRNWRPEYRVQVSNSKLTLGYIPLDDSFRSIKEANLVTAQNYPVELVIERSASEISVSVTGQPESFISIEDDGSLPADIDNYDRLFLSVIGGEDNCTASIETLRIEDMSQP